MRPFRIALTLYPRCPRMGNSAPQMPPKFFTPGLRQTPGRQRRDQITKIERAPRSLSASTILARSSWKQYVWIDGKFTDVRPEAYYGGQHARGVHNYLYRLPDGRWFFHTVDRRCDLNRTYFR